MLSDIGNYILIILPLAVIEFVMKIIAIVDIAKPERKVKWSKAGWIVIVAIVNVFGWIAYFLFGRDEK